MRPAPRPEDERERLEALRASDILDTPPEADFDALTRIAAAVCGTPIALVSLLDEHRQWFKSKVGLEASELPRDVALCAHAILEPDLLVVPDARADQRFADNPLVLRDPHIRFYAGTPLRTAEGHAIGTLCVIDHVPRQLTPEQRSALRDLGQQATAQIELRRTVAELRQAMAEREHAEAALRAALESAAATAPLATPPRAITRPGGLALAALVAPLALTLWGAHLSQDRRDRERHERFSRAADQIAVILRERLTAYEQVLRGGSALFAASARVNHDAWRKYVDSLGIEGRYPGILGLGYITRLPHAEVPAFEAGLRAEGIEAPVRPAGDRPEHFAVTYVEPMASNAATLGVDMAAEPRRRAAAEAARDGGGAVMTAKLELVEDPRHAPGFLLFAPDYARTPPPSTVEERRQTLRGWVFAAARARDLLSALPAGLLTDLDLEVYDGTTPSGESLVYDEVPPMRALDPPRDLIAQRSTVMAAGRPWTLYLTALPGFEGGERRWERALVLAGGSAASLALFGLVWSLATARRGAIERAERMTSALRASEQRVRSVMDTVADAIVTFDRSGKVHSANPAAEWLFGRRLADLIGRDIGELIPGVSPAPSGHVEAQARRTDGDTVPVDVAVTPTAGAETLVAIVRDVSERRAAERALRESEQRIRSILDNTLGGLITVDEAGTIESVNPSAAKIFGYETSELVGQHLAALVPESVGDRRAYLREAFARAIGKVTEWRGQRKSGEEFPFELSMFQFESAGAGRHFAGSVRDVSERHAVEKLKQEFVSTVSHELRTPLASIRGSLSLLSGGVLGELSDEAREMVAIAERNCGRLISLVNDILDLERLEQGRLHMEFAKVRVAEVLGRAREAVHEFARLREVQLEMEATSLEVDADAGRLVQVLVNLVSNAVKFSPPGSTVRVAVREHGGPTRIEVIDRGRGVPAEHLSAIFERFRQVESSDAREKGGTGLGLAICKAIVEQHGGQIGVESDDGKGSTFWFELPGEPAPDLLLESFRVSDGRPDVLLADHDTAMLGVLVRQLVNDGVRVRVAMDGEEAERAVHEAAPRLLVVDLGLPDGEGRRLLSRLRAEERLSLTPLLVYTEQDIDERLQHELALGPTRFLTKSRASDAEVGRVVYAMLETEAREAHS